MGVELSHLLLELGKLLFEVRRLDRQSFRRLLPVGRLQLPQIAQHALFELSAPTVDLVAREVLIAILNFEPSMATQAVASSPICRHSSTNRTHTFLIANPLSLRKSAITLSSGTRRPSNQITSRLRPASRSRPRLEAMRLR
jgi:hypothetical protein